jgi:long-chain acyl-CoA synthetase
MGRIAELLKGKTVFITGATGFLGQPLVEKILWVAPEIKRIYVLIRPKRQLGGRVLTAQQRLERELFQSSAFERSLSLHGDGLQDFLSEKLVAIAGDISTEDLGIDPETLAKLYQEVDIVINSAAVVSFDAPLDDALELNVFGASRVARFARCCQKALLVHVSTAYVAGATSQSVPETMHHDAPPGNTDVFPLRGFQDVQADIEHMERLVADVKEKAFSPEIDRGFKQALLKRFRQSPKGRNSRRREKVENLRKKWIEARLTEQGMKWARQRGWNDTYTYTKALGEQMVVRNRGDHPTAILRPSVIESSLSEPSPGWLDGLRMADPLIVAIGKGRLRSLPLKPEVVIDLVPVDMVVNALLASLVKLYDEGGLHIYQVATGAQNPVTLGELYELIFRYFTKNPMLDRNGDPIKVRPIKFPNAKTFRFQHRLKSMPLSTAERTLERLSRFPSTHKFKRRISATRATFQKLYYYGEIYQPYLNLNCRFETSNTVDLFQALSEDDQLLFPFDVTRLNWRHYIQNVHIPGVKKYILKVEGGGTLEPETMEQTASRISTINELLRKSAESYGQKCALQIRRDGKWTRYSFLDLEQAARELGLKLLKMGMQKGDRVVLYSENQPEWGLAYLGAASIGLVVVPIDAQTWLKEVWSVARFTESKAILTSAACFRNFTPDSLEENRTSSAPLLLLNVNESCEPFSGQGDLSGQLEKGVAAAPPDTFPDDLASIIFTTGTAVDPKGAMHTHRNFLNNLFGVRHYLRISESDQMLSVLPLYHALEFTCGFLMPLYSGTTVTYLRSLKPKVILETMRETGVTTMLGVPTLYALIREDIQRRILGTTKSAIKSNLMSTSKQLSKSVERTFGKNIGHRLFARVHQEFGGQVRLFVSGGSTLGDELYEDFKTLGMPIYEGYGLTETAPVLTVNPENRSRRGSAGKPLPGVELRLFNPDKDGIGEFVVRSPSLMLGYYKNPAATAQAVRHGWFHTGDLGWVDEDGYVYITGRIKDVIVTGAGKNVYPADLEAIYQSIPEIKDICVLGMRSGLTEDVDAVVVADEKLLAGLEAGEARKVILREIQRVARELPSYQRLQHVHVWPGPLPRKEDGAYCRETIRQVLLEKAGQDKAASSPRSLASIARGQREELLYAELSRLSGVPVEEIRPENHIHTDLGLDSLMTIELLLFIEAQFGATIPDEEAVRIESVGDILADLDRLQATQGKTHVRGAKAASTRPYSRRSAVNRYLLGLSFSGVKRLYRSYFDLAPGQSGPLPSRGTAYIIAANHSSHLDTGAIISALGSLQGLDEALKLHVLGARDYFFSSRLKGWFFSTFLNVVPIEREETSLAGLRMVRNILSSGDPVLIFPEGSRSRDGQMRDFRPGLGLIAWELDVPIVPAFISGTHASLPAGRFVPRRSRVSVRFGTPISMNQYRSNGIESSRDELYRRIAADVQKAVEQLARETRGDAEDADKRG